MLEVVEIPYYFVVLWILNALDKVYKDCENLVGDKAFLVIRGHLLFVVYWREDGRR